MPKRRSNPNTTIEPPYRNLNIINDESLIILIREEIKCPYENYLTIQGNNASTVKFPSEIDLIETSNFVQRNPIIMKNH